MVENWTEEDLIALGYSQQADGSWKQRRRKPSTRRVDSSLQADFSGQVPPVECGVLDQASGANESKDECEEGSKVSDSRDSFCIKIVSYRRRDADPDNLCPKYMLDEIVRAGVIPDDSSKYVEFIEKRVVKIGKESEERTVIEIFRRGCKTSDRD